MTQGLKLMAGSYAIMTGFVLGTGLTRVSSGDPEAWWVVGMSVCMVAFIGWLTRHHKLVRDKAPAPSTRSVRSLKIELYCLSIVAVAALIWAGVDLLAS